MMLATKAFESTDLLSGKTSVSPNDGSVTVSVVLPEAIVCDASPE